MVPEAVGRAGVMMDDFVVYPPKVVVDRPERRADVLGVGVGAGTLFPPVGEDISGFEAVCGSATKTSPFPYAGGFILCAYGKISAAGWSSAGVIGESSCLLEYELEGATEAGRNSGTANSLGVR